MKLFFANLIQRFKEWRARREQAYRDDPEVNLKSHLTEWERQEAMRRVRRELHDQQARRMRW